MLVIVFVCLFTVVFCTDEWLCVDGLRCVPHAGLRSFVQALVAGLVGYPQEAQVDAALLGRLPMPAVGGIVCVS